MERIRPLLADRLAVCGLAFAAVPMGAELAGHRCDPIRSDLIRRLRLASQSSKLNSDPVDWLSSCDCNWNLLSVARSVASDPPEQLARWLAG